MSCKVKKHCMGKEDITWSGIRLKVFQETFVGIVRCDGVICTAECTHPVSMTKIVVTLCDTTQKSP